jgi:hypothetical protein
VTGNQTIKPFVGLTKYYYATVKYNPSGALIWNTAFQATSPSSLPCAIALDRSQNIYVAAPFLNPESGNDFLTLRYHQTTPLDFLPLLLE